jgi:hypothetical protein
LITDQTLIQRVRSHREVVRTETAEALAAYFAGERLYEYIYPFSRTENNEKLNWRRFLTVKHYRNYPKEIGRKYLEGLFRGHSITRKYDDEDFDQYLVNKYDSWFRREVAMPALYLPELFVVITLPEKPEGVITKQDESDLGIKPYPVVVYPQHVRDFALDADGNVEWITFDTGSSVHAYTAGEFITADTVVNEDGTSFTINSRKAHGFNRCPVVRIAYEDNAAYADVGATTPVGHAMMKEIVSLAIADLQYRSMLVEAGYAHLFYKVVMGEETAKQSISDPMGNSSVIIEAEGENGKTRYMATPSFEIQALKDIVFTLIPAQIYQQARLRDNSVTIAQSGLAKTFDLVPETGVLSAIAEFLSVADEKIVDLLADAWLGKKAVEMRKKSTVTYPASFDVRSPLETMGQFSQFVGMAIASPLPTSKIAIREMVKDVQRSMLPNASSELLQKIDEETDKAPFASSADEPLKGNQQPFPQTGTGKPPGAKPPGGSDSTPNAQIVAEHAAGASSSELTATFGVSRSAVQKILEKSG